MDPSIFRSTEAFVREADSFVTNAAEKRQKVTERIAQKRGLTTKDKTAPEKQDRWEDAGRIAQGASGIFDKISASSTTLKGQVIVLGTLWKKLNKVSDEALKSHSKFTQFFMRNFKFFRKCVSTDASKIFEKIAAIKQKEKELSEIENSLWEGRQGDFVKKGAEEDRAGLKSDPTTIAREAYFRLPGKKANTSILEGSTYSRSLMTIKDDVGNFRSGFEVILGEGEKAALQAAGSKLEFAENLSRKIEVIGRSKNPTKEDNDRLNDVVFDIQNQVRSLQPGEEMLIPGGYLDRTGGHAVIYSIKKQDSGKLSFTIHNTGDGSNLALNLIDLVTNEFLDFINKAVDSTILGIDEQNLINPLFLRQLIQQRTKPNSTTEDNPTHSMEQIFKLVKKNLKVGRATSETGKSHPLQVNGTCTHDSVTCWLQSNLEESLFEQLDSYMIGSGMRYVTSYDQTRSYLVTRQQELQKKIDADNAQPKKAKADKVQQEKIVSDKAELRSIKTQLKQLETEKVDEDITKAKTTGLERQQEKVKIISEQFSKAHKELEKLYEQQQEIDTQQKIDTQKEEDYTIKLRGKLNLAQEKLEKLPKLSNEPTNRQKSLKEAFTEIFKQKTTTLQAQLEEVSKYKKKLVEAEVNNRKNKAKFTAQLEKIKSDISSKKVEFESVKKQKEYLERLLGIPSSSATSASPST